MKQEKTFDFDDEHGRNYDDRIARSLPGYDDLYKMTASYLAVSVDDGAHILVTGAGGGKEISVLSQKRSAWRFMGVDPSEKMIGFARNRFEREGIRAAKLHVGALSDLPTDIIYDAATSLLVLHFLPDHDAKRDFLSQVASRLKPGAPLVLASVTKPDESVFLETFDKAWFDFMIANGIDKKYLEERFAKAEEELKDVNEATVRGLLQETGFEPPLRFFTGFRFVGWFSRRKK